jgi:hypothetical protein
LGVALALSPVVALRGPLRAAPALPFAVAFRAFVPVGVLVFVVFFFLPPLPFDGAGSGPRLVEKNRRTTLTPSFV